MKRCGREKKLKTKHVTMWPQSTMDDEWRTSNLLCGQNIFIRSYQIHLGFIKTRPHISTKRKINDNSNGKTQEN